MAEYSTKCSFFTEDNPCLMIGDIPKDICFTSLRACDKDIYNHLRILNISCRGLESEYQLILARFGLFTDYDLDSLTICEHHRNILGLYWRPKNSCRVPAEIAAHKKPDAKKEKQRSLTLSQSKSIYLRTNILVPVGSGICTACRIKLGSCIPEKPCTGMRLRTRKRKVNYSKQLEDSFDNEKVDASYKPEDDEKSKNIVHNDKESCSPVKRNAKTNSTSVPVKNKNSSGTKSSGICKQKCAENNFVCEKCGKTYKGRYSLRDHMLTEHNERAHLSCDICSKSFPYESKLRVHMRIHSGDRPYKCDMCGKTFIVRHELTHHVKKHTGQEPFRCKVCGLGFCYKGHLARHTRTHTGEKLFRCQICNKSLSTNNSLTLHMKTHTGKDYEFVCEICGKQFGVKFSLESHIKQQHTDIRPHECKICGKAFAVKRSLTMHIRIHTGKSFVCELCGSKFTYSSSLSAHKKTRHSTEKPFHCDICGTKFKMKNSLSSHMKRHTDAPSMYVCEFCSKPFRDKTHLRTHRRIHTGEKPFKCKICGNCFNQNISLNLHMSVHTGQKRFQCETCDAQFNQKSHLVAHTKKIHQDQ